MRPKGHKYVKGMPHLSDADYLARMMADTVILENGCWQFTAGFEIKFKVDNGTHGYRDFSYRGKPWRAHRLSWILHNKQPIPEGMVILHSCDFPPCVNPAHLTPGTRAQNNNVLHVRFSRFRIRVVGKRTFVAGGVPFGAVRTAGTPTRPAC